MGGTQRIRAGRFLPVAGAPFQSYPAPALRWSRLRGAVPYFPGTFFRYFTKSRNTFARVGRTAGHTVFITRSYFRTGLYDRPASGFTPRFSILTRFLARFSFSVVSPMPDGLKRRLAAFLCALLASFRLVFRLQCVIFANYPVFRTADYRRNRLRARPPHPVPAVPARRVAARSSAVLPHSPPEPCPRSPPPAC